METRVRFVVVGAFVFVVAMIALFFGLWVENEGSLQAKRSLRIAFAGPAPGLRVGAPVTFNGLRVGEVTRLSLDRSRPEGVDAFVSIDTSTPVNSGTRADIETSGLMGSPYIALSASASGAPLAAGPDKVATLDAPAARTLARQAQDALAQIQSLIGDNSEPLRQTFANLQTFTAALARNADKVDTILAGLDKLTGGSDKPAPVATYDLPAPTFTGMFEDLAPTRLVVNDPTSVVTLDTQKLLVQSADGAIAPRPQQWTDSIPKLVQKKLVQSFDNSGFRYVTAPTDGVTADVQLLVDVRRFGLFEGDKPRAEVALGLRLLAADGTILGTHVARGSSDATALEGAAAAKSVSSAFAEAAKDALDWTGHTVATAKN